MSEEGAPAIVGLTGGIGSGKSTVASMFAELGVPVLDLDRVGHQVTAPGSEGLAALIEEFGNEILDGSALNRERLASICFANEQATRQLNMILHPLIWREAEAWVGRQHSVYVVLEASVLIESGGCDRVDRIVVVMASVQARKGRVLARGNMDAAMFESIVARQCDDDMRLSLADEVIRNDRDIGALHIQVEALHARLMEQFGG